MQFKLVEKYRFPGVSFPNKRGTIPTQKGTVPNLDDTKEDEAESLLKLELIKLV